MTIVREKGAGDHLGLVGCSILVSRKPGSGDRLTAWSVASPQPAFHKLKLRRPLAAGKDSNMLWTIFVILLVLWLLGMVSGYAIGGFIHILLVIALVVLLLNIIGGRRVV